jgi:adenine-specific DNA glycosylase
MLMEPRLKEFQETIWQYYRLHGRNSLPWRRPEQTTRLNPYKIMVSEYAPANSSYARK